MEIQELNNNPLVVFQTWFDLALATQQPEPEAMILATVDAKGYPHARVVLLKGVTSEEKFLFFTNYTSAKAQELAHQPRAALTFYWHTIKRQIRIEGTVEKTSQKISEDYFHSRPRGSQLSAWASPQSQPIDDKNILLKQVAHYQQQFAHQEIPLPPFWGGYALTPEKIEFWQLGDNRLHDRFVFNKIDQNWQKMRIAP